MTLKVCCAVQYLIIVIFNLIIWTFVAHNYDLPERLLFLWWKPDSIRTREAVKLEHL